MKEIIIDGCNVAECEFYDKCNYTTCQIGIQNYIDCDKNPNCMFKQLQRAKADITKINIAYMELIQEIVAGIFYAGEIRPDNLTPLDVLRNIKKENKDLKAENEKLKDKAYKDADMIYRLTEENREYDIDLSIEKEAHKSTIERLDKYHKALEDIKARIKQYHLKVGGEVVGSDTIFDIEKKINEVLDD